MVYITGDIHGNPKRIIEYAESNNLGSNDIVVILGDAGFNYSFDVQDNIQKNKITKIEPTVFCIHGNHEARPAQIKTYKIKVWHSGKVYYEEEYPNLLFAIDGEIYDFDGKKCMVIGGAYSVDKYYRIMRTIMNNPTVTLPPNDFYRYTDFVNGKILDKDGTIRKEITNLAKKYPYGKFHWFYDEQPDDKIKEHVESQLKNNKIDIILSHTCPIKYEPVDVFLKGVNQDLVDKSTEKWLDYIEQNFYYKKWYCGHYHIDRNIDKLQFMFNKIEPLSESM